MSHRRVAAPMALILLSGAALAQDDAPLVGVSVEGTVVEVAVEAAAEACGLEAEALLAEWESLGTEIETMADTSVRADATDLAPAVEVDTAMDAAIDGETVADGADATHERDGEAAQDLASDLEGGAAEGGGADGIGEGADGEPAPEAGVPADGSMDAGVEVAEGTASEGDDPASADLAGSAEVAAAGTGQEEAAGGPATPTSGTVLSKAAVCEISRETAESLGLDVPG